MDSTDIVVARLISQQIAGSKFTTVKDLVGWMGALQAQDYAMSKWAVGMRLPSALLQDIETAIDAGDILRTHVLRPTWHLVSASDIYWMLALTAPQIKSSLKLRYLQLGLSETVLKQSSTLIEKALSGGKHLTREELLTEFKNAKMATDDNRASHLLLMAELDGLICSGAAKAGKPTYALLAERVPQSIPMTKEEALATLAKKYFSSRSPATLQDFVWWSGLSAGSAKMAAEMVESDFVYETIDSQTYWCTKSNSIPRPGKGFISLLPAYDEFIISYRNRQAALPFENFNRVVSSNGIFRPTLIVNGQVMGIWKRTILKDKVRVEIEFFASPHQKTLDGIEKESVQYGKFLGKNVEIAWLVKASGQS